MRTEAVSSLDNMYTLRVRHGSVRTSSTCDPKVIIGADERLAGQAELMNPIAHHLDDLTVVYSVHDTPTGMLSWEYRQEVLEHIEEEECAYLSFTAKMSH